MTRYSVLVCGCTMEWCSCIETAFADQGIFDTFLSTSAESLLEAISCHNPDVLLWKLDQEDPLPILQDLLIRFPFTIPVVMTDNPGKLDFVELLRSGVRGCLPCRLRPQQITNMVDLILNTGIICLPELSDDLLERGWKSHQTSILAPLTKREITVLSFLGRGLSNPEIAERLALSESTIKTHLRAIYRKLNVTKRSEAIILSKDSGLLDIKDLCIS